MDYPKNLIRPSSYEFQLESYADRLTLQAPRLFHPEKKALVDFLEFAEGGDAFWPEAVSDAFEIRQQLGLSRERIGSDPRCRFIFVRATHSREKLKITREMLTLVLSYHQVNPAFLDFIFPFGRQEYPQDYFFSAFRVTHSLDKLEDPLVMPSLGRSGRSFELCFNLKSVEKSRYQEDWPWSYRQCAVNHYFDVENGRMVWILVEADPILKRRISSATGFRGLTEIKKVETAEDGFRSSLETLLIICEWAAENWRWYLNFVEEKCQRITRGTLSQHVQALSSPTIDEEGFQNCLHSEAGAYSEPNSPFPSRRTTSGLTKSSLSALPLLRASEKELYDHSSDTATQKMACHRPDEGFPQTKSTPPIMPTNGVETDPRLTATNETQSVTFDDLQRIQFIEENINDVALLLRLNTNVIDAIADHYDPSKEDESIPKELRSPCHAAITRFRRRLQTIKHDLQTQHLRTETMLRLLAVRKSLAHGIFDVQNMEANQRIAVQGQSLTWQAKRSAQNMELMTREMSGMTQDMNEIAKKTKLETISMRIITLVTLFFLPGTFISTLMSTDIIRFKETDDHQSRGIFQIKALQIYLAVSLPLVLITLVLSYAFYLWSTRSDRQSSAREPRKKSRMHPKQQLARLCSRIQSLVPVRSSRRRETFHV